MIWDIHPYTSDLRFEIICFLSSLQYLYAQCFEMPTLQNICCALRTHTWLRMYMTNTMSNPEFLINKFSAGIFLKFWISIHSSCCPLFKRCCVSYQMKELFDNLKEEKYPVISDHSDVTWSLLIVSRSGIKIIWSEAAWWLTLLTYCLLSVVILSTVSYRILTVPAATVASREGVRWQEYLTVRGPAVSQLHFFSRAHVKM